VYHANCGKKRDKIVMFTINHSLLIRLKSGLRLARHSLFALESLCFAVIATGFGCSASNKDILDFLQAHEHKVSAIEYRIGVPDRIAIDAPRILEIDGEAQQIQPDGKINLNLLGEVRVVGMTAKEIAAKMQVLAGKYYLDPKVNVRVVGYASKKYYIFGQVSGKGPFAYTGKDTLLDIMARSGLTFLSWKSQVRVIRPSHDKKERRVLVVNVDKMIKEGDLSANILIEPGDIIFVPPTPLAWVGLKIRELLFPIDPVLGAYTEPLEFEYAQDEYDNRNGNFNNSGNNRSSRGSRGRSR